MRRHNTGLEFTVVWGDPDVQEIAISAYSQSFAGSVNLYASPDDLARLADGIHGFPDKPGDRREFELGQEGLTGYGTARLRLFCNDSTGHVTVEAALMQRGDQADSSMESAVVRITAVPSDIDQFETELRALGDETGACAKLKTST